MKNPTMLYKHPGAHEIHGDKFDYVVVDDHEVDQAKKDGWSLTTTEAKAKTKAPAKSAEAVADDNAPPTREELEAKATELGIKFDGRTSDSKLGGLIAKALEA